MARTVGIGIQDFGKLIENHLFYVDKTAFIKEWWESGDDVTLITRPRRFGKTVTMSMLDYFFSNQHEGTAGLFEGLDIFKEEKYRQLQGTYPVLFLSFAGIKTANFKQARIQINQVISDVYSNYVWIAGQEFMTPNEREFFGKVKDDMDETVAVIALQRLCGWLEKYYGKKVLIFLDEYDTPMQEAYLNGYWDELTAFIRTMFNNTFKTNPSMTRAVMTGITRVSKESIFSDLNNLKVVTTTSKKYETAFGFTEEEVFAAMDEQGMDEKQKKDVKKWYDGFTFGKATDIYNPWSIINFLEEKELAAYWANTSGNGLVSSLLQRGDKKLKMQFEDLLVGSSIKARIDEQIVFSQLDGNRDAVFSLLLACGYLKLVSYETYQPAGEETEPCYTLALTNLEVRRMFRKLIRDWFKRDDSFGEFVTAMLAGDVKSMNRYMNRVALNTFGYFDTGRKPSFDAPERFYHGFVLGLLVENAPDYIITSNRESGFGRYDVVLEPREDKTLPAAIMEFKVYDKDDGEEGLADTAGHALDQIEEKNYAADLIYRGIPEQNIRKYGLAFRGQECLILGRKEI